MSPFRPVRRQQRWWINFTGCCLTWEPARREVKMAAPVREQLCWWWQWAFLSPHSGTVSLHEVGSTTNRGCSGRAASPGRYPHVQWPENKAVLYLLCWRSYHTTGQHARKGRVGGLLQGNNPAAELLFTRLGTWQNELKKASCWLLHSPTRVWDESSNTLSTCDGSESLRSFCCGEHSDSCSNLVQWISDVLGRLSQKWPVCCQVPGWETPTHDRTPCWASRCMAAYVAAVPGAADWPNHSHSPGPIVGHPLSLHSPPTMSHRECLSQCGEALAFVLGLPCLILKSVFLSFSIACSFSHH